MTSVLVFDHSLSLGEKVRLLRIARGWRQCDLSFHAAITPAAVSALERDIAHNFRVVERVEAALGVELDDDSTLSDLGSWKVEEYEDGR